MAMFAIGRPIGTVSAPSSSQGWKVTSIDPSVGP
jgi:hypothetical protein